MVIGMDQLDRIKRRLDWLIGMMAVNNALTAVILVMI
jgi:hypothetical protein